ncbi:DegV family protein [Oceanotoga sp. DSM 15011]|uniref:DegV family protein n=1 Tax=Oceanotoga sp. DSM 15011 TaxID=2984951 RepID=UPI0021F4C544|nr:DegV family protein [Oceanotoga sp. DSM 15011]UYO99537.1 DegV family protein [Oceanotoga sp. DSM 15011]
MENSIGQICDSASNLPDNLVKEFGILKIPFYITFDDVNFYRHNIDISDEEFFKRMEKNPKKIPKTAAPNINDWYERYEKSYKNGNKDIIVTTISPQLSGSFQNANIAKKQFLEKYKDSNIEVINSKSCTCGQAALEISIAKMIKNNFKYETVVKKAKETLNTMNTLFSVKTLKYMKEGGRIGGATAFLGKIINIKPIAEFVEGEVKAVKAVRGRKNSLNTMTKIALSRIKEPKNLIICTREALCKNDENYIIELLKESFDDIKIYSGTLGAVIGAHSGPGSIGIGFVECAI